jgi:hypothetical protein
VCARCTPGAVPGHVSRVRRDAVNVVTIPARHRYVDAAVPAGVQHLHRHRVRGWEPDPAWTDPDAVAGADLVHVHFGFDHLGVDALAAWCSALAVPLVVSVHDLRNPHHGNPETHRRQLRVLLHRADAVLTLTPGAAAVIERDYGRPALVVEHGAIYDGPTAPTTPLLVGVSLKSLRRNLVDPARLVRTVLDAVEEAGGRLEVTAHRDSSAHPAVVEVAAALRDTAAGSLQLHQYLTDDEHRRALSRLQVSVLPNRWGTHSGWLEACRDVGTRVVAPSCGHYDEQWREVSTFRHDERRGLDADSLRVAVTRALTAGPIAAVDHAVRVDQQRRSDDLHRGIYRHLVERAAA